MLKTIGWRRDVFGIDVFGVRRRIAVHREKRGREKRLDFADEIRERLRGHGNRGGSIVEIDSIQHADDAMALRIDNNAAARAGLNRVAIHRGVVEREQARRRLALVRAFKAQQLARMIRFFRVGVDLDLLAELKLVQAERGAMVMRQRACAIRESRGRGSGCT